MRLRVFCILLTLGLVAGAATVATVATRADSALAITDVDHDDQLQKQQDIERAARNNGISPDRLIVAYQPGADALLRDQVHAQLGATVLQADAPLRREVLRLPAGNAPAVAERLSQVPGIRSAAADRVLAVGPTLDGGDPLASSAWGVARIGADQAWSTSKGAGVKVAVLDCGVHAAHPDLTNQVSQQTNFSASPTVDDRCNHGTHVAGTIAALTGNGIGVDSVAPGASLLNVKVVGDDGHGLMSDLDRGLRWAADNGARVANLSLGFPMACPPDVRDAINYAYARGVVVVAAAGNAGAAEPTTPANCAHVVSVGAVDQADARAAFSNYAGGTQLAAPGVAIGSTINPDLNGGHAYGSGSGTSMAAPHVSGVAALVWATPRLGTSVDAVVQRLQSTADPIPGTGSTWRFGRIDALKAVSLPAAPAPGAPTAQATTAPANPNPAPAKPSPTPPAARPTTTPATPTTPTTATARPPAPTPRVVQPIVSSRQPTPAAAVPTLKASLVGGHVQVQWSDGPTPGVSHSLARGDATGQNLQPIATDLPAEISAVIDASAEAGRTYVYQVTSQPANGGPAVSSARVAISVPR